MSVEEAWQRPDEGREHSKSTDVFWSAVFDAETKDETLQCARELGVSLLGRHYFQVCAIAENKSKRSPLDYVSPGQLEWELGPYPELSDWCTTHLGRRGGR